MSNEEVKTDKFTRIARRTSGRIYTRAEGYKIYTDDGREFIDMINGKGSIILGHNDPDVIEALRESLQRKENSVTGESLHMAELAATILDDFGDSDYRIAFYSTGTAAVRASTFLAREKKEGLILSAGYHGWDPMWRYEGDFMEPNRHGVLEFYFIPELLEEALDRYQDEVSMVIVSPDLAYLKAETMAELISLTKSRGVTLCYDDVKQGYRHRQGNSLEIATDQKADMYTFSKGLANGYRISCVMGHKDILKRAEVLSYTAYNEVTPYVAARATLKKMAENNGYQHIKNIGTKLTGQLATLLEESDLPIEVNGTVLFQFVFDSRELAWAFYEAAFEEGLLLWEGDNQVLSYAFDDEAVEEITSAVSRTLEKIADDFSEVKGKKLTPEQTFRVAWSMLDGATDNIPSERRIELARELA